MKNLDLIEAAYAMWAENGCAALLLSAVLAERSFLGRPITYGDAVRIPERLAAEHYCGIMLAVAKRRVRYSA